MQLSEKELRTLNYAVYVLWAENMNINIEYASELQDLLIKIHKEINNAER